MAPFLGFLLFTCIAMLGFWVLTFLLSFLPYWIAADKLERLGGEKKTPAQAPPPMGERIWTKA